MTFNEYQQWTRKLVKYPKDKSFEYLFLALGGEIGETQNIAKKVIRDNNNVLTEEYKNKLESELGDAFFYIARICDEFNFDFEKMLINNVTKLEGRLERNTISGEGETR